MADRGDGGQRRIETTKREYLMMGVFFLILLFLHLFPQMDLGDDPWYAEKNGPLWEHLVNMYWKWTSRLLIEAITKILAAAPHWIWRMLNTLMTLLLVWSVADLFGIEKDKTKQQAQLFFFVLMWSVPLTGLKDAGWITTTINYLWTLPLGLMAAHPMKRWARGEKCPAWEYAVSPLCMILSANVEQTAAVLLGAYLLFGACMLIGKKRLPAFYFLMFFLSAASIVFALITPGNGDRALQEIERLFPEFVGLTMPQKLLMGFIDTACYYFAAGGKGRNNYVFALLAGILLAGMWQKRKEQGFWFKAIVALVPFLFCWGIGRLGAYLQLAGGAESGKNIVGLLGLNRCLPIGAGIFEFYGWIPYPMSMVLLQAGVYLAILISVALTIYFLHGRSYETLFELIVLGAGLLSRLILGFSPTLYASGERTTLCCSLAVLAVCLRNLQFFWNGQAAKWNRLLLSAYIAGVICVNLWGGAIRDLLQLRP